MRPSIVVASLSATNGREGSCTWWRKLAFCAAASSASRPTSTSTPCARSHSAPPAATGLRLGDGRDDPPDAGGNDGLRAWRLLALVGARLEGAHQRGTARARAGRRNRRWLGVALSVLRVPALADALVPREHHRADQRVGLHPSPSPPGQLDRARHGAPLGHVSVRRSGPPPLPGGSRPWARWRCPPRSRRAAR